MAVGDVQDFVKRLKNVLPHWFGEEYPLFEAKIYGIATVASFLYQLRGYAKLQTRISTATDEYLDLIAQDFFGDGLLRKPSETDAQYRRRILTSLFAERATRRGLFNALKLLTGNDPILYEPFNTRDCLCLNVPQTGGLNVGPGKLGTGSYPYNGWADVFIDAGSGMSGFGGLNQYASYLNTYGDGVKTYLGSPALIDDYITDQDIYNLVNITKVYGTIVWVRINRI